MGLDLIRERPARPSRSLAALEGLRQQLRKLFLTDGSLSIALGLAVACFASFLCDYSLHLPFGVRLVFLFAGIAALVIFVRRKVLRPLAQTVSDEDLAKLVERSHPEFQESLLTAIELTRDRNENAAHVSSALLQRVVQSVEERIGAISLGRILDRRQVHRKMLFLALALCLAVGFILVSSHGPTLSMIWLQRNLLLSGEEWPRRVQIELVSPQGNPTIVALGDSLDVDVRVVKGSPAQVFIEAVFEDGRSVRRDALAELGGGLYRRVFPNVARAFEFSVEAGDHSIDRVRVDVRLRPRIDMASIRLWCTYPGYTGWQDTPQEEPLRYGNLKVPVGTAVRYEMAANVPIRHARFFFEPGRVPGGAKEGASDEAPEVAGETLVVTEGQRFGGEFVAETSGQFYFELETAEGFPSRKPDRFRVEAVDDQKPLVRVVEPARMTEEVSPSASIAVRVNATDDYGLVEGSIFGLYFPSGSDQGESRSFPLPNLGVGVPNREPEATARRPESTDSLTLEVPRLVPEGSPPPRAGARFQFRAQVTDSAGNLGESEVHQLNIVDVDDLLRILTAQLMVARDQLREVVRRQQSVRKDLSEFQQKALLDESFDSSKTARLMRHRQDQQRITRALERETQEMNRVLGKMVANNVGNEKWRKWVEGLRRDLQQFAEVRSPAIESKMLALEEAAAQEPQDPSDLNAVTQEQRALERDLEALVLRLSEFGDFNALVELLREVRRRQTAVRDATQAHVGGTKKP